MTRISVAAILTTIAVLSVAPMSFAAEGSRSLEGSWSGTYTSSRGPSTGVVMVFQQSKQIVTGNYLAQSGAQGVVWGSVTSDGEGTLEADQKTDSCTGHFQVAVRLAGGKLQFRFKGKACEGTEEGGGSAVRALK